MNVLNPRVSVVIVNSNGEFFSGDWANIRWVAEYPRARLYTQGYAKREASKLRVECDDPGIHAVRDYGLDSQMAL